MAMTGTGTEGVKPPFEEHYYDRAIAQLQERVTNQGTQLSALNSAMQQGFTTLNERLSSLATDLNAGRRPQWQAMIAALGVAVSIIVAIGALAYLPIQNALIDLKGAQDAYITRAEVDQRSARAAEDRDRTGQQFRDIQATMITKDLWSAEQQALREYIKQIRSDLQQRMDRMETMRMRRESGSQ